VPLTLLLDEHISPTVAQMLRNRGLDAAAMPEWHGGKHLSAGDEAVLAAAHVEGRTLVSFDLASVPDLLHQMAIAGIDHSGVILVSQKTVKSNDFAGLTDRLVSLAAAKNSEAMDNVTIFL